MCSSLPQPQPPCTAAQTAAAAQCVSGGFAEKGGQLKKTRNGFDNVEETPSEPTGTDA
jgi:hypothetical protein